MTVRRRRVASVDAAPPVKKRRGRPKGSVSANPKVESIFVRVTVEQKRYIERCHREWAQANNSEQALSAWIRAIIIDAVMRDEMDRTPRHRP